MTGEHHSRDGPIMRRSGVLEISSGHHSTTKKGTVMTFKKSVVTLVFCALSGLAVAAAPEGGGKPGKEAGTAPTSAAMQEMMGKTCPEHSGARADDGRELECVKGAWQAAPPESAKSGQSKAKKRAVCRFRCSVSHGIEVCRGNGPQCNGVSPW